MEFTGYITFVDELTQLAYVEMVKNSDFGSSMFQINNFYNEQGEDVLQLLNLRARSKIPVKEYRTSSFFCAKYYVDQKWYRVKLIAKLDEESVRLQKKNALNERVFIYFLVK
jgi:hypothetical protein